MDSQSCRPTNSSASTLSLLSPPTSLTSLMFPLVPDMIQCPDKTWHSSFVLTSVCIYLTKYLQSKVILDNHVMRKKSHVCVKIKSKRDCWSCIYSKPVKRKHQGLNPILNSDWCLIWSHHLWAGMFAGRERILPCCSRCGDTERERMWWMGVLCCSGTSRVDVGSCFLSLPRPSAAEVRKATREQGKHICI